MRADRQGRVVRRYAIGLYRVSTAEEGSSGLGLEAQQASVRAFCGRPGAQRRGLQRCSVEDPERHIPPGLW
jgi:hypothetical protein